MSLEEVTTALGLVLTSVVTRKKAWKVPDTDVEGWLLVTGNRIQCIGREEPTAYMDCTAER